MKAVFRDDTILRLGGDAGWAGMTWAADDLQYAAACDGAGWSLLPRDHFFSSRLFAIGGDRPENATGHDVPGYPDVPLPDIYKRSAPPLYYGFNVLAVDGCLYQFLSTSRMDPFEDDLTVTRGFHMNAAKLIYSPDGGRTWHNHDGSSPVVRELHDAQTPDRMVFVDEPEDTFAVLTFLQMGKDYGENRDGYVYVYGLNGYGEGAMNALVLFRVPKDRVRERGAYEYFQGIGGGGAGWSSEIGDRAVVQTFPGGWLPPNFALSWLPSVVYNAPLGVYVMACSNSTNPEGVLPGTEPSYLGLWVADQPWGPWEQVYETEAWTPAGDRTACAGAPVIAPKWVAADGRSFWLVWNDAQLKAEFPDPPEERELIDAMRSTSDDRAFRGRLLWRQTHPYYGFNVQRVDLE